GTSERGPLRVLAGELPSPERRDAVVASTFAFLRQRPRSGDPALCFEEIPRRLERSGFKLQEIFRGALNVSGDRGAVARSGKQRAQDQQIERAAKQLEA